MKLRKIAVILGLVTILGIGIAQAQEPGQGSTLASGTGDLITRAADVTAMVERPLYVRTVGRIDLYTNSTSDPVMSCALSKNSIWHTFIAPQTGRLTIDTYGSNFDTTLAVYRNTATAANQVACNDDTPGPSPEISFVNFPVQAGTRYYVLLGAHASETLDSSHVLIVNYVSNRLRSNAFVMPATGNYTNVQEMIETATNENLTLTCGDHSRGVWYSFRPSTSRKYEFSTAGSSYDTVMAVVRQSDTTVLACNDDIDDDDRYSRIRINLVANTRYWIFVGKYDVELPGDDDMTLSIRARPM